MTETALAGIRILDFTRVLAGPLCTMMLADLGADVIKVEHPQGGDDTRSWGPPWFEASDPPQSAYYLAVNRNKRSIALNLKTASGQQLAKALAQQCQVVVENFMPGQMVAFGLGYEQLAAHHPGLVYCSITGYGQTGPYRERPGYDYVIQAMSGLMAITGEPAGEPIKVGVAIADVIAGLNAATAILAALRHSERTGHGQQIDIALLDTQFAALVNVASGYLISGVEPQRYGSQHPNIVPYQTFMAADGALVVAVGNDSQFAALCSVIGQPEWASDERFATNPARVMHRDPLVELLAGIFVTRPAAVWVEQLLAAGIPAGPIHTVGQALHDPHSQAREIVQPMPFGAASLPMIASPLRLRQTPPTLRQAPPHLGQHTDEILRDLLGCDPAQVAGFRAQGAIG